MPALQVREFPENLYEELRAYAADHHRSMAQQTIAAVEQVVRGGAGTSLGAGRIIPFESAAEHDARMAKRRGVFERAAARRAGRAAALPSPADMLAQARAERDEDFSRLIQETGEVGGTSR